MTDGIKPPILKTNELVWRNKMSTNKVNVDTLAKQLVEDVRAFGDKLVPEVVYLHLHRAYKLGQEDARVVNTEWWAQLDKDSSYVESKDPEVTLEPFDEEFFGSDEYMRGDE